MEDRFNPATYMVIDKVTGEEVDIAIFVEQASANGWEKAYAKVIADYINCAGDKSSSLLAWIIKERDRSNLIQGTQKEISDKSQVSLPVVKRVLKRLVDNGMIKKVRSGCYMVSPKMIRTGRNVTGAMLLRIWDESK